MKTPQTYAAFDAQGLNTLKRQMKGDSRTAMQGAAREMEGLFVQMMLKSMRQASFGGGLLQSQAGDMMTSLYDQQIAQDMAGRGQLGLAEMMLKQFGESPSAAQEKGSTLPPVTLRATAPVLSEVSPMSGIDASPKTQHQDNHQHFIRQLMKPAMAVAQQIGLDHHLIIAQAALESGWGKGEIKSESGQRSHNLFGVKASPDWAGKTTEITTTEFVNGIATKTRAHFRVYDSYADALKDYSHLITDNPRYRAVTSATNGEQAAQALQRSGYATDPHYASKLITIMQRVKDVSERGVAAYKTDFSTLF